MQLVDRTKSGLAWFVPLGGVATSGPQFNWIVWSAAGSAGWPGCGSSEHLLRGIGDVEEAVRVSVAGINLSHAGGHAGHAFLCHKEEQSLSGVQGDLTPDKEKCKKEMTEKIQRREPVTGANPLPEQTQELTQGELKGNQELCLVQQGESLFTNVTFNNHLKTNTHLCWNHHTQ